MSEFPPLSDYGLIGDTRSAALVNRRAGIDWLCWPRFDSPAVFCAMLDRGRGGRCELVANDPRAELVPVSRRYRPGTLILETILAERDRTTGAERGRLKVVDAMPVRHRPCRDADEARVPAEDVDHEADGRLVRDVRCEAGVVDVSLVVWPTFDFASAPPARVEPDRERRAILHGGPAAVVVVDASSRLDVDASTGAATLRLSLRAGDGAWLALAHDPATPRPDDGAPARWIAETDAYWTGWTAAIRYDGPRRDAVERGMLTLKAMTHSPTGAIVAAPTAGLPEAIGAPRNYDYRFSWVRDSGFTVRAMLMCGHRREARAYLRFLLAADIDEGRRLPVLVTLDGKLPDDERRLDHLAGYANSRPVVVGNLAATQRQNDVYGEAILAIFSYWDMTGELPPPGDAGRAQLAELVRNLAASVESRWSEPDAAIWERRDEARHHVHTKALCWLALDRAAKLAGPLGIGDDDAARWRALAQTIRADYQSRGWSERLRAYAASYEDDASLDAAPLRAGLLGAFDAGDPRFCATVAAVRERLSAADAGAPDLIYRYRGDDGIEGDEGTFTSAAFWVATCLALGPHRDEGEAMFDRLLARGNDLGLFAEEIGPRTGAHLGNTPQAFTHMAIVHGAARIAAVRAPRRDGATAEMRR